LIYFHSTLFPANVLAPHTIAEPRPRNARIAFIDEAFSALSKERIEQMVKFLEDNNFQVFYAAPPEKINSIGQHIDNTVSLYTQGKYTKPVEGSWYSR
jgi:uncharacterized protein YPO0396